MTTELTMLLLTTALLLVLVLIQAAAGVRSLGLAPLANSRDGLPPPTGFHARMLRVVDNHREGLTIFTPLVLIAHAAGIHSGLTALAAQAYFGSRVLHAIVYVFGLPLIRPLIWGVGLVAQATLVAALLGIA